MRRRRRRFVSGHRVSKSPRRRGRRRMKNYAITRGGIRL